MLFPQFPNQSRTRYVTKLAPTPIFFLKNIHIHSKKTQRDEILPNPSLKKVPTRADTTLLTRDPFQILTASRLVLGRIAGLPTICQEAAGTIKQRVSASFIVVKFVGVEHAYMLGPVPKFTQKSFS